jgi:hypothetical protein
MKSAIWITLVLASCAHAPPRPPADALQSLADARGTAVYYAMIFELKISGDVATVVFGSDIRIPRRLWASSC